MRLLRTFTISLPPDLAAEVDRLAVEEHRTRSELFREAFRRYVNGQRRWERILAIGPQTASATGLDSDAAVDTAVDAALHDVRQQKQLS